MIDPLAIGENIEYIAKKDRDSGSPTIWIIGPLDSFQQSKILSTLIDIDVKDDKPEVKRNKDRYVHNDFLLVKYGLKGFKNFGKVEVKTEKIKLMDRDMDVLTDDMLKVIPLDIIHELAEVIWNGNKVSEELRKN